MLVSAFYQGQQLKYLQGQVGNYVAEVGGCVPRP